MFFLFFGVSFCRSQLIIIIVLLKKKTNPDSMVRPIVIECLGVAGPKELPEAAALGRESAHWTAPGLPRRPAACCREKRALRGLSYTVPKGHHPLCFCSVHPLGSPRRHTTTRRLYKQSPPTRGLNSLKKSVGRNSQHRNPGNILGLFFRFPILTVKIRLRHCTHE